MSERVRENLKGKKSSGEECTTFVDNLNKRVSRRVIRELFHCQGKVLRVYIPNISNKPKYRNHTFAFVQFEKEEGLRKTIMNINGTWIDGKRINVGVAKYQSHQSSLVVTSNKQKEVDNSKKGVFRRRDEGAELSGSLRDEISYKDALVLNERMRDDLVVEDKSDGNKGKISGIRNV
ncbi:probable RNA-binding protein 19 [Hibiscus syriacus]|uniref:probable RNA-binding protein 19 n=1 Tax=Hibiscus syriacus TaxID=106335 RepID=UPI001921F115|nr:probable RNA-binding protein 19 [Hibiscus syriacus]